MNHKHKFQLIKFKLMQFTSQNERKIEKCNCGLIKYTTFRKDSN
jgi:hypothetical protein